MATPAIQQDTMNVFDHLSELRYRIMVSLSAILIGTALGYMLSGPAITLLQSMAGTQVTFIQLTPGEAFFCIIRISILMGWLFAIPILLYHLFRFVMPGLVGKERLLLGWILAGGTLLFALGVFFAYTTVAPSALSFLLGFGADIAQTQIGIGRYIDFCLSLMFMTGLSFELPMVLFLLSMTGLVTSEKLLACWRQAIIGLCVLAAIITPSQDPLTMLLMAGALSGLYFVSLVPIRLAGR